jgi:LacI family transcriptional regulator
MEMLANGSIDGFIMSLSKETNLGRFSPYYRSDQRNAVVMFDRVTKYSFCDKVIIDDKHAAYEAVQSLIKGRKKLP